MAKNASLGSDILKTAMPKVASVIVKILFRMIPAESPIDKIMEEFKSYWKEIIPVAVVLLMQATKLPDLGDDAIANLGLEVERAIKERYTAGDRPTGPATNVRSPLIRDMIGLLPSPEMIKILGLIGALDEKQKKILHNTSFSVSQADALAILKTVSDVTPDQFKVWAEMVAPVPVPRVPSEFEKKIVSTLEKIPGELNKSLKSAKKDVEGLMENPTIINSWADSIRAKEAEKKRKADEKAQRAEEEAQRKADEKIRKEWERDELKKARFEAKMRRASTGGFFSRLFH